MSEIDWAWMRVRELCRMGFSLAQAKRLAADEAKDQPWLKN